MSNDEIHIDSGRMRSDRREALIDWVRSLGFEPRDIRPEVVIRRGEREWELHVSRYVRNEHGGIVIDEALGEAASIPVVIPIGSQPSWPALGNRGIW